MYFLIACTPLSGLDQNCVLIGAWIWYQRKIRSHNCMTHVPETGARKWSLIMAPASGAWIMYLMASRAIQLPANRPTGMTLYSSSIIGRMQLTIAGNILRPSITESQSTLHIFLQWSRQNLVRGERGTKVRENNLRVTNKNIIWKRRRLNYRLV